MTRPLKRARTRPGARRGDHYTHAIDDYWTLSARPLHALAISSLLVLIYELCSLLYLTDLQHGQMRTIKAKNLLADFMQVFGVAGLLAPGIALLVILLIWHVLSRDAWHIRPMVLLGMILEAAIWTFPLLVFGALLKQASSAMGLWSAFEAASPPAGGPGGELLELGWPARATISLGAGLYEELLFRLMAIALLHFAVRDVLSLRDSTAKWVAVGGSALAFALYHRVTLSGGEINWPALAFYFGAGVYFALLYLSRGFGIAVLTHALYDVAVLVVLRPN
ncbi:MAG: CPBP family intramembrane metalloprotease [Phycisphaerae bacterium]|nr:CPBP family intramembrane metalloprotease [Phycisphaerae bacterium]